MPKLCQFENCKKRAVYGYENSNPLRCKLHKEDMKNVIYKLCSCGIRQQYNYPYNEIVICCTNCKKDGMIDIKHKKCSCGISIPVFNFPTEKKGICCSKCKEDGMVDVITKKCKCGIVPVFNFPNETNGLCCSKCKKEGMVDIKNKKCKCGVIPNFNLPNNEIAICCIKCKEDGMINIKHKKCKCGTRPNFNYSEETTPMCCSKCKEDGMVDVNNKMCKCGKKNPSFNFPGESALVCCSKCKEEGMVYRKNNKIVCKGIIGSTCPFNSKANRKYKNYCVECFRRNFPLDPLTFQIRCKTKEIAVRDFINANFEGFQHDKTLFTGSCDCTMRRRIDHRKLIGNTLLVIETDENQHKSYDKMDEEIRYDDLFMAFSGKWIYIRFNPDKYKDKKGNTKNPTIGTRLETLKNEITSQIKHIENNENNELLERIYMYYDNYN